MVRLTTNWQGDQVRAASPSTRPLRPCLPRPRRGGAARPRSASETASGPTRRFYAAAAAVFAFLVLGRGAAYCGLPPLYGGELTLCLLAVLFVRPTAVRSFLRNPVGLLVAAYLLVSVPRVAFDYHEAGMECFIYAAIAYYAVFYYFGYAVADTPARQSRFVGLLYYALLAAVLHVLVAKSLPLAKLSPRANDVPLLGNTDGAGVYTTVALAYALIFARQLGPLRSLILAAAALASQLFVGARGTLLSVAGSLLVLAWYWKVWVPRAARYLPHLAFGLCFLLCVACLIGPDLSLREAVGHQSDLVVAIVGDSPNLPSKAGSKFHRKLMWRRIVTETYRECPWFGQGFRGEIVDASFRNPHNSFINIFGRMGFAGLALAACVYFGLPLATVARLGKVRDPALRRQLLFFLCYFVCFLGVALTGPALASPYSALVNNFMFGVWLRCYLHARPKRAARAAVAPRPAFLRGPRR